MRINVVFFAVLLMVGPTGLTGQEIKPDHVWKFAAGDELKWALPGFDDSSWKTISTLSGWENQGYPDLDGFGWYRKQVVIPAAMAAPVTKYGGIMVKYDNADDADEFYFNGQLIGATGTMPPSYQSKYGEKRSYIVPARLIRFGQPNLMAVRVYDGGGGGGLLTPQTTLRAMSAADAISVSYSFPANEWVFKDGEPQYMELKLKNTQKAKASLNIVVLLTTDKRLAVDSLVIPVKLGSRQEKIQRVNFKLPEPGFYRFKLYLEKDGAASDAHQFNIGYEPEKVLSPVDARPDFDAFWEKSLADLALVKPDFRMTLIPERSTGAKNIYHVEMMSYLHTKIEGYYAAPKAAGRYPAIAVYMGYGSDAYFPHSDGNPGFCEFILSVRGQGIQKPVSVYGKWINWGLAAKETYYYRGAFLDLVRAIDFLVSRPEVDADKIVAEGGSQGGAFTLAACALDPRIKAAAPTIPFLSDYRDYFEIVHWPASDVAEYVNNTPHADWEKVYEVLSYFDIKNLAPRIKCPVYMAVGLQDEVCPPHTNFAGFNNIAAPKKWVIYRDQAHSTPATWYEERMKFFRSVIKY